MRKSNLYIILLAVGHLLLFSNRVGAQEVRRFPSSLSLKAAIDLAFQYHPSLRSANATMQSSEASLTLARSAYMPVVGVTASATRTDGAFVFNPSFPPRIQSYNNYSTVLNIQQTVYDFGKTDGRVSGAHELLNASQFDYDAAQLNVINNVEVAYFGVLQAEKVVGVTTETLAQAEAHLNEAQAYYAVGTRPQIDVTTAKVNVANARVNLIRARNQLRIAGLQFENSIGVHSDLPYTLSDSLAVPSFSMSLDSVKAIAMNLRQDLLSARARMQSSQSLVSSASDQRLPTLALAGSWSWSSFNFPLQSRWNAGVTLSLPLFQGYGIDAQVDQAEANLESSQANLALTVENALLDVEQNYLSLKEASDRIDATAQLVGQTAENLKIAEGRYNFGVGSAIEITDAQVALANARLSNIQALYDYNSSIVKLKRAMGVLGK
ncbi:MAG TPA: TolC family protein [Bacteroidota bacterium]|nr:TolC family protein [Bacteroidota bacterium]